MYLNINCPESNKVINPFKVAGFESKEWLRSSEIKEDRMKSECIWILIVRKVNVAIIPIKVAGFESKERLRSSKIKEDWMTSECIWIYIYIVFDKTSVQISIYIFLVYVCVFVCPLRSLKLQDQSFWNLACGYLWLQLRFFLPAPRPRVDLGHAGQPRARSWGKW